MRLYNQKNFIKFTNVDFLSKREIEIIRGIRNELFIRKNMFNSHKITEKEHDNWAKYIKKQSEEKFYAVFYKDKIVGGLGLKSILKNESAFWSFYISQNQKVTGLGPIIEYIALNYFFKTYNFKKLYCFVLNKNNLVIKLHKKFGFTESKILNKKKLQKTQYNKVTQLEISRLGWKRKKNKFNKVFENEN